MTMQLTPDDLTQVASKVKELAAIGGIDVRQIKVNGHVVFLKRETNQKDGDTYYIVGISNKDHPFHEPSMRDSTRGGDTPRIGR